MSDLQAIVNRIEIEALRGEFTDAVMMNDHDRLASRSDPRWCRAFTGTGETLPVGIRCRGSWGPSPR